MEFSYPTPFPEALEKLRARQIVPAGLSTAEWAAIPVAIRERAFFSSRVESARLLQEMRNYMDEWLLNERAIESHGGLRRTGRAEFVANMREIAIREGLGKIDPETGEVNPEINEEDLRDIRSTRRLELIFDTQTEAAQEYGYWQQGQDPDILHVYPAQRFIRVRPVLAPRAYHQAALGEVRRKDDTDFWISLNRDFGVPWGPWGFGSGCGVEDVDRDEAIDLGLMKASDVVKPAKRDFNDGLSSGIRDLDADIAAALAQSTGGTSANGQLTPRQAPAVQKRVFPRLSRLTTENVESSLKKLARYDGTKLAAKANTKKLPDSMRHIVDATLEHLGSIIPPALVEKLPSTTITAFHDEKTAGVAGKFHPRTGRIRINADLQNQPDQLALTVIHEAGHWLWKILPAKSRKTILDHFAERTAGEKPFTRKGRKYFRDHWAEELAGREDGTEVLPYHLELLDLSPKRLADKLKDSHIRQTLELILSVLGIDGSNLPKP